MQKSNAGDVASWFPVGTRVLAFYFLVPIDSK